MKNNTTTKRLQERQDAPQVLTASAESFNATTIQNKGNPFDESMPFSHRVCGYNSHKRGGMSAKHNVFVKHHISPDNFVVVDDTYRCVRRKLHDSQFSKGGIRYKYSTGNAFYTHKGTMCSLGQICGATGNSYMINDYTGKRISKSKNKIEWLSHHFKHTHHSIPLPFENSSPLEGSIIGD